MQLNQGDIEPGILVIKAWVPGDSGAWGSGGYGGEIRCHYSVQNIL